MNYVTKTWHKMFDIRPGEQVQTWAMFGYLFAVLMAYYIVKPVSRSMFLTKFDVDKLPSLYIVIAIAGGIFAYLYSKVAAKTSLNTAVLWTMLLSVISLWAMWALIYIPWMIYVLNIWVSLFSIVLVSQGWLVAGNIFNARQAKRLYPLLGMSMVLGAASGGEFTNRVVHLVGTRNLLLACAAIVILAYGAFRIALSRSTIELGLAAHAGAEQPGEFSFAGIIRDLTHVRHLRVIVGLMVAMYVVDTLVEYQLQYVAGHAYHGDRLTAFFGQFYGLYLNGLEAVFQLFLTAAVVRRFGVGYTLQIAPVTVGLSSIATVIAPGVLSGSIVRLTEASTRYTLNRTGMELLYMPLPRELRNRVKAFIDISIDRLSRGVGGVLLLLLTGSTLHLGIRGISVVVIGFCGAWAMFSLMARNEYVASIRRRVENRGVDLHAERITVSDAHTISFLEQTATTDSPRQAAYAIGMLAEAPDYDPRPLLKSLAQRSPREVEDKVYEIAAALKFDGLLEPALAKIHTACATADCRTTPLSHAVVGYALTVSPDRKRLAAELLQAEVPEVVTGVLEGLRSDQALARELISREWLNRHVSSEVPQWRTIAALAVSVRGDQEGEILHQMFEDPDAETAAAAYRAAGILKSRLYLGDLIRGLGRQEVRAEAIIALVAYGQGISGTLSDVLLDDSVPLRIRLQIPRVLKQIPHQRAVDGLMPAIGHTDVRLRTAVLKALNALRETSPELHFDNTAMTEQFLAEAHYYFELNAVIEPFRQRAQTARSATNLLVRTGEARLQETLGRLFRLLGLRYPPKEIYSTYRAVSVSQSSDDAAAALEFLDSTLEPDFKRILIPLLDASENTLDRGRELFGVAPTSVEDVLRNLIATGDPWLRACALAAAAEMNLQQLAPEIAKAATESDERVSAVARFAKAALGFA